MKRLLLTIAMLGLCTGFAAEVSDAERHQSTEMNAAPGSESFGVTNGAVKIVFIGNSITLHAPSPKLGWTNNCGMAASETSRDYVHLVVRGIEEMTRKPADVRVRNLAPFERGFETWDIATNLKDLIAFKPDILIVALGENVKALPEPADVAAYEQAFRRLLAAFGCGEKGPRTIVRGVFWRNPVKDAAMRRACDGQTNVTFVEADVSGEPGMTAKGLFTHPGVQGHPGDAGMREIATRILGALEKR